MTRPADVWIMRTNMANGTAPGCCLRSVIDRDRVEEHNVGAQLYGESEVGSWKIEAVRSHLFRAVGVEIEAVAKELTERNSQGLLTGSDIVLDAFDNSAARQLVQDQCRAEALPCLHVGLFADYAEVIWDESYRVPRDVGGDVCDYPLARNLVLLAVAVASESLIRFVLDGSPREAGRLRSEISPSSPWRRCREEVASCQ
jgi:molybdopterin-synthase adenylyltransferase